MLDTVDFLFQTVPKYLLLIEQTTVDRISTEMTFQRKLIVFSLLGSINLCHANSVKDVEKSAHFDQLTAQIHPKVYIQFIIRSLIQPLITFHVISSSPRLSCTYISKGW